MSIPRYGSEPILRAVESVRVVQGAAIEKCKKAKENALKRFEERIEKGFVQCLPLAALSIQAGVSVINLVIKILEATKR